jgi:hypothetical protein
MQDVVESVVLKKLFLEERKNPMENRVPFSKANGS